MSLIHKGVRPVGELTKVDKRTWSEELPDGGLKLWNKRTLSSGCGKEIKNVKVRDGLIYCRHCDEWFCKEQMEDGEVYSSENCTG